MSNTSNGNTITIRREMASGEAARDFVFNTKAAARFSGEPFDPAAIRIIKKKPRTFVDIEIDQDFDPKLCRLLIMAEAACEVIEATRDLEVSSSTK